MDRMQTGRAINTLSKGFKLLRKPYKTEFEQRAATSFKRAFGYSLISLVIFLIYISTFMILTIPGSVDRTNTRAGIVVGDSVRYTQNNHQFVKLVDIGIDPSSVKEGDDITLIFNPKDELVGGEVNNGAFKNKEEFSLIAISVSTLVFLSVIVVITIINGKAWGEWSRFN